MPNAKCQLISRHRVAALVSSPHQCHDMQYYSAMGTLGGYKDKVTAYADSEKVEDEDV